MPNGFSFLKFEIVGLFVFCLYSWKDTVAFCTTPGFWKKNITFSFN